MKILFENWRKFLEQTEDETPTKPKAIFMAGGPGSGKSTVLRILDLPITSIVNADDKYEADLKNAGLSLSGKPVVFAKRKELKTELGNLEPESPEYAQKQKEFDVAQDQLGQYNKIFNAAQVQKRADYKNFSEPSSGEAQSFIVDGTAGNYNVMAKEKRSLEEKGYDVAMIYVDVSCETALARNKERGVAGRQVLDRDVSTSCASVQKNKKPYQSLFGQNFFYVDAEEGKKESSISKMKSSLDSFIQGRT